MSLCHDDSKERKTERIFYWLFLQPSFPLPNDEGSDAEASSCPVLCAAFQRETVITHNKIRDNPAQTQRKVEAPIKPVYKLG
jgi:hypothetical protein